MSNTIIITESQFNALKNILEDHGVQLDNGNVVEFGNPSEVGTSTTVTDTDGEVTNGKDVSADEYANTQSYQGYWSNGRARYN